MILNLTQHPATPEQLAAGVRDLNQERQALQELLTFDTLPTLADLEDRADAISLLARREFDRAPFEAVMIGGDPFFMIPLEAALTGDPALPTSDPQTYHPEVLYAFSRRESIEQPQPDGSVKKVNIFRHAGFVQARRTS